MAMLRWTYTDELELSEDDAFLIDLMKLANRFQLHLLRERWACHGTLDANQKCLMYGEMCHVLQRLWLYNQNQRGLGDVFACCYI